MNSTEYTSLLELINSLKDRITYLENLVAEKDVKIARLEEKVAWFNRQLFGTKSEKIIDKNPAALDLFGADVPNADVRKAEAISAETNAKKPKVPGHGRNELPKDRLPVEVVVVDVSPEKCNCPQCNQQLVEIGRETSQRLCRRSEYIIKTTVRIKRACKEHPESGVIVAAVPASYIDKGIADESVIAHCVTDKYLDNIPLHRQESRLSREGILIPRSTMVGWLDRLAFDLALVVEFFKKTMLQGDVLYSDDTKIPVVGDEKGKTKKGFFWTWSDGSKYVVFDYTDTRGKRAPTDFVEEWRGFLHSDAYESYAEIHRKGVKPVYCWAHVRRRFFDAHKSGNRLADRPLQIINRMFKIERLLKEQAISPERALQWRSRASNHCEEQLFAWCRHNESKALPAQNLGRAIAYYRNHREGLRTFLGDSRLCIDNNLSERNLRKVVIGRKNWLFAGSDEGAQRAAIFYSVIGTCILQGIDPREYLEKFMKAMAQNPKCKVEDLVPGKI